MCIKIRTAAAVTAFLAGAGIAYAQGYTTQNPGTMTPSYSSPQELGPSGVTMGIPSGTIGYGSSTGSNYATSGGATGMRGATGAMGHGANAGASEAGIGGSNRGPSSGGAPRVIGGAR
jgi:hypothetical protein